MKHAIKVWKEIEKRLRGRTILLFLDFDGTLAPIVTIPSRAHLPVRTRCILKMLKSLPDIRLTIISGRDISDIRKHMLIPGIFYAGNHGCQISGPKFSWNHPFPVGWRMKLRKLRQSLLIAMKGVRDVFIEGKKMSIVVHYRNVRHDNIKKFQEILNGISKSYLVSSCIKVSKGKKVVEFGLATPWNKGKAVNRIIHRIKISERIDSHVSVYIGDDVTDETAFKTLKHKGITIHVGTETQSAASYYLRNPAEVATFLGKLSTI